MTATRLNPQGWRETVNGWNVHYLEDGTGRVEIWRDFYVSNGTWSAWGSLYELKITDRVSYPFAFTGRPTIRVEPYHMGNAISGIEIGPNIADPTTVMPYIYILRPTSASVNNDYGMTVYVTGWKA